MKVYYGYNVSKALRKLTVYEFDKETGLLEATNTVRFKADIPRKRKLEVINEKLKKYGFNPVKDFK